MNGDVQVRFCERPGGQFPGPTRLCWTELGAERVGQIQSLIATCRLHEVDPYVYLVDVLQRIEIHPQARVDELTPRLWKERFADHPMRSAIDPDPG